jgi:hypothetical protein
MGEAHFCHTLVRQACTFNMAGLTSGAIPNAAWMAKPYYQVSKSSGPISGRPTVGDGSLIPHSEETMPHRQVGGIGLQRQVARGEMAVQVGRVPMAIGVVWCGLAVVDVLGRLMMFVSAHRYLGR